MIGEVISHYRILEKLGEGGMGVVYKAQDTKLDRVVALKFLPHFLTSSETERARFLQEAKAASALNHPNVCTIYGIEEHDGQPFIEMELVEGVTLKHKFSESPLKIQDAIGYAVQIGEALQEAHSKGIVHRDVKSENIMVNSKNQIKVMDFGLAKLRGSVKLTKSSSTTGTLAYMAPEQIQGADVDARADIFSFGVVLYEMLAGQTPFRGEHEAAMMYSIVNEDPQPIQKFRDGVSSELLHILNRALEKDPEDRYQTVKDMTIDLRRLKKDSTRVVRLPEIQASGGTVPRPHVIKSLPVKYAVGLGITIVVLTAFLFRDKLFPGLSRTPDKKMIVVLPFENLGPDDKDYFVDGMTDEVTSRLSGLSELGVIARSSASQYRQTTKSFRQIGEELGVQFILKSTVRWETIDGVTHVRVNPSLINVDDGTQKWSQSMESVMSGAFKLQSDIATRVASALDVVLLKSERQNLETTLTNNAEAYDYYLQAVRYGRSDAIADMTIGIQLLERAIAIDPNFAAAYAKLSYLHSNLYWFYYDRSEARVERSRIAAEKAVEIAPGLSESHEAMGWYYYHGKLDYPRALEHFDLALKYRPSNSEIHYGIAAVLRRMGDMQRSVESFQRAVVGNPREAIIIRQMAETMGLQRDYEEATLQFDRALRLTPDDRDIYLNKIETLLQWKGDIEGARRILDDARRFGKTGIDSERLNFISYYIGLMEKDFETAGQALNQMKTAGFGDQFQYYPKPLLRAHLERQRGNPKMALVHYDSARVLLEQDRNDRPNDERVHSALGIAYAGLGRTDDAVRSGLKGVELLPVEKEAWRGSYRLIDMANIYTMTGNADKAIDILERLLAIPAPMSVPWLKIDSTWEPLRNHKRFQKLIAQAL
jgi:serine/threonine protein kinase/tetratricopeptide (TPR) repeat protein